MSGTRVAIMQPYFFPYLGYWQMMRSVDTFVVYDTVQYTSGWMNRNRYRNGGRVRWMTVPVRHGPARTTIRERRLADNFVEQRDCLLSSLDRAYRGAPHRDRGLELVETGLAGGEAGGSLLELLLHSMHAVRELLGITSTLEFASNIEHDESLPPEQRLIELSLAAGGDSYYQLSGGRVLYSPRSFAERGLELRFREFDEELEGGSGELALSIVDLVMRYDLPYLDELLAASRWSLE
ncbi:MAG: hypothetical protein D3X82_14085 [Candidatus Leucobacter sulfamidivorax]|nr:hypothetical protein [Candidatus Leucobacter sulfamidivorax]